MVSELIDAIGSALECNGLSTADDHAGMFAGASVGGSAETCDDQGADGAAGTTVRGGLAPWQIRRVATHIESNLDAAIHTGDLARIVRLSPSHFMRSFRSSFGYSPHRYIMRRRMERAQGLMLTTQAPLGQIALDCGLADQSHLTRLFQRFVGESPGMWRRARATNPG